MNEQSLPADIRDALDAFRRERTGERWTALSQLWVGDIEVLDALRRVDPEFPDPFPLPVEDLVEDNAAFFQWPVLPDPDTVLEAILRVLDRKE